MALSIAQGYIQDPNNPNGVIKANSTAMPGSIQAIQQSSPSISYGAVNNSQNVQTQPAYVAPATAIQQTPTTNYTNPNPTIPDYNAITTGVLSPYTQQATDQQAQADLARKQADDQAKLIESKIAQIQGIGDFQSQLQDQAGISGKQQNVTELTARLKQLAAEQQASQIQLTSQQQALAKPGVTSGVINAQSAELARQNVAMNLPKALEALTTSAQLDVAQGNLANAEAKITQAVNLKYKTLTDEISARQQLYNDLSANATRAEQKVLDAKQKILDAQKADLDTKKAQQQDVLNAIQSATANGANVSALASQVIQLDPNSATFTKDLADIQTKIPSTGGGAMASEYQFAVNNGYKGSFTQYQNEDANRKAKIAAAGVPQPIPATQDINNPQTVKDLANVNLINNVLANPDFASAFGKSGLINQYVPGSPAQKVIADVQQVKDILSLAARGQLKGQGQISDFEGRMLANAQTALNSNLSAEDAKQALINVRGAILTSSGASTNVAITDPKTGETRIGKANSALITQAIANGYRVTYQQ